jgi:hypothetical protein
VIALVPACDTTTSWSTDDTQGRLGLTSIAGRDNLDFRSHTKDPRPAVLGELAGGTEKSVSTENLSGRSFSADP